MGYSGYRVAWVRLGYLGYLGYWVIEPNKHKQLNEPKQHIQRNPTQPAQKERTNHANRTEDTLTS